MGFLIRVLVNAVALWITTRIVTEVSFGPDDDLAGIIQVAIVFGLVNAVVGTLVRVLTFPAVILSLGLSLVVINAAKVKLTGRKEEQKIYRRHSGYPGGLTEVGARKVRETRPARMIEEAIQGMLPKTKLGKQMYRKLNVYAGDKHPHQAQKPVELKAAQ